MVAELGHHLDLNALLAPTHPDRSDEQEKRGEKDKNLNEPWGWLGGLGWIELWRDAKNKLGSGWNWVVARWSLDEAQGQPLEIDLNLSAVLVSPWILINNSVPLLSSLSADFSPEYRRLQGLLPGRLAKVRLVADEGPEGDVQHFVGPSRSHSPSTTDFLTSRRARTSTLNMKIEIKYQWEPENVISLYLNKKTLNLWKAERMFRARLGWDLLVASSTSVTDLGD